MYSITIHTTYDCTEFLTKNQVDNEKSVGKFNTFPPT